MKYREIINKKEKQSKIKEHRQIDFLAHKNI